MESNATMDVRSYEAGKKKGEENAGNEVEVVWACDEKRGTLRRKEVKERRKAYEKMVGPSER